MKNRQSVIRAFIAETFLAGSPADTIGDETSFLDAGIMDSMRLLELVEFLEERFDVNVEDSELIPENLDSVDKICTYLASKGIPEAGGS